MTTITETDAEVDVLTAVTRCVAALKDELPAILDACTDPEATDLGELLWHLQQARIELQGMERDVEVATAKAMLSDNAESNTLRMERSRTADRKTWDHKAWQADVRTKALQASGLKGAQGVIGADGEVLEVSLTEVLRQVQEVHGSTSPRLTALRGFGIDPDDYCERQPGAWKVKVTRLADENEGANNGD